jgi:hypothetical protein
MLPDMSIGFASSQALHFVLPEGPTGVVTSDTVDEVIGPTQWHVNPDLVGWLGQHGDKS